MQIKGSDVTQPAQKVNKTSAFMLRREPLYHKLQYSKVPKFDAAAAVFGVAVGAFAVYLGLSSLGSASADLTDLTCLCWYVALWLATLRTVASLLRSSVSSTNACLFFPITLLLEVGVALMKELHFLCASSLIFFKSLALKKRG